MCFSNTASLRKCVFPTLRVCENGFPIHCEVAEMNTCTIAALPKEYCTEQILRKMDVSIGVFLKLNVTDGEYKVKKARKQLPKASQT